MRLRDRPPLYIALVRAPGDEDLRETAQGEYQFRPHPCIPCQSYETEHLRATSGPYRGQSACLLCVARSQAARAIGQAGGRKGGRSTSARKGDAARANGEKGAEVNRKKKLGAGG